MGENPFFDKQKGHTKCTAVAGGYNNPSERIAQLYTPFQRDSGFYHSFLALSIENKITIVV